MYMMPNQEQQILFKYKKEGIAILKMRCLLFMESRIVL